MPPVRSDIWNIFIKSSSGTGGRCKLCSSDVKTSGNTTNLKKHLMRRHPNYKFEDTEKISKKKVKYHRSFTISIK